MRTLYLLLITYLLINTASAGIGLGKDYLERNILMVNPGETYYYNFYLSNSGDTATNMVVTLDASTPIAKIQGNVLEYYLPAKTYNKNIKLVITIPPNTEIGSKYRVGVKVRGGGGEGGMISLANEVGDYIWVQVGIVDRGNTTNTSKCLEGFEEVNGQCMKKKASGGGLSILNSPAVLLAPIILIGIFLLAWTGKLRGVTRSITTTKQVNSILKQLKIR